MKQLNDQLLKAALIVIAILSAQVMNAQSQSTTGYISYHKMFSTTSNGAQGSMIEQHISRGTIINDEMDGPFHLSTQTCSGTNVIKSDGSLARSFGSCDVIDGDGDIWFLSYHNTPSGNSWEVTGGLGKYKNMKGGGSTKPVSLAGEAKQLTIWFDGKVNM